MQSSDPIRIITDAEEDDNLTLTKSSINREDSRQYQYLEKLSNSSPLSRSLLLASPMKSLSRSRSTPEISKESFFSSSPCVSNLKQGNEWDDVSDGGGDGGDHDDDDGKVNSGEKECTTTAMTPERHDFIIKLFLAKASKIMYSRRAEMEQNAALATLCVRDAFEGRLGNGLATNSTKSPFIFGIYSIQTDHRWMNLVILSSIGHTILTFMEPVCSVNSCLQQTSELGVNLTFMDMIGLSLLHLHYVIWLIHALDVGMKVFYQGVMEYFNHDWQQLYFLAIALHFVDLCVFGRTYMTNPLRPVVRPYSLISHVIIWLDLSVCIFFIVM